MPFSSSLLCCFCATIFSPIFCLFSFPIASPSPPLSISVLSQPSLTNSNSSSLSPRVSSSASQIKPKCASPLNRLLLCAGPSSSTNYYPYAGWLVSPPPLIVVESNKENRSSCFDRSGKCADFVQLCRDTMYHLFLRSYCSLTCGYCGNLVGNGGRGAEKGGGDRAATKSWRMGEKEKGNQWNGRKKSEALTTTAKPMETKVNEENDGTTTIDTTKNSIEKWGRVKEMGTNEEQEEEEKEDNSREQGQRKEKCEDEGRNCAAMERMCGRRVAQQQQDDIMGTFCRKTCKLC